MKPLLSTVILGFSTFLAVCCGPSDFLKSDEYPPIIPDYVGVTVPEGMPELEFRMADGRRFTRTERNCGDSIIISVRAWEKGSRKAVEYASFPIYISKDPIDPFIAYRLIEPGYESWSSMGIYQRELSSFRERAVVTNRVNERGCVNCHNFNNGDAARMMFHSRGLKGGTVITGNNSIKVLKLNELGIGKQGSYPAWHPGGRYIAFSSNTTKQCFPLWGTQPVEVYDSASDLIILDLGKEETFSDSSFCTEGTLETFPAWSEDGRDLYYCAAEGTSDNGKNRGELHYRIMKTAFTDGKLLPQAEMVWQCDSLSASFPRIKGKYMLFTVASYGTFPIWHREADLWLMDLETGEAGPAEAINSPDTESYHSWSSNGRWVIFSSRRDDGRYTRLYIAHFDGNGNFGKPFLLPQRDPHHNDLRLKSYNIPEFVKSEVPCREKDIRKALDR